MYIDEIRASTALVADQYPGNLRLTRYLKNCPLRLGRRVTVITGENGTGKSTLLLGIALAYGLDSRGGHGGRSYGPASPVEESWLELRRDGVRVTKSSRARGYFHRADMGRGLIDFMSRHDVTGYQGTSQLSSGEAFRKVALGSKFEVPGLYLLDEPEASLSVSGQLELVKKLQMLVNMGAQVFLSTHSPLLAKTAGSALIELRDGVPTATTWGASEMCRQWTAAFSSKSA